MIGTGQPFQRGLRIHAIQPRSRANGPGLRATLWLQGCTLACPGCFNPETHPAQADALWTPAALAAEIAALDDIEGVTISGGEPLQQVSALTAFLAELRARSTLSIVLFTGFEPEEIQRIHGANDLLATCDVLVAGRYRQEQHTATNLRGSANKQTFFLTDRYTQADFMEIPPAEVWIDPDGILSFSGIEPLKAS